MTKIGILGATGYTAVELMKLLLRHPETEIVALTSRRETAPVGQVHPSLAGRLDLSLENLSPQELAGRCECVFGCLPHRASAEVVPTLLEAGVRVVDFSADYRLSNARVFSKWYGVEHPDPERLGKVPYGLPELFREKIRDAELVANPGCYPTSAILGLAPLLRAGLIEKEGIIVDAKSGVSGAGRNPKPVTHFPECNESIAAYGVGTHRHTPEIEQILATSLPKEEASRTLEVLFTPHLTPMDRGILSTCYGTPSKETTDQELLEVLRAAYSDEPFVKVVDRFPATKDVAMTNFCHVTARRVRGRVMVLAAIDNLIKGASGAAVQNYNLMFGYPETTALL
jgi:N-acetyl-gamma-glutamyl-phosphate reductase